MGLSSLPSPSESLLTLLLVNTALTISILKEIFRSARHLFFALSPENDAANTPETPNLSPPPPAAAAEHNRTGQIKPLRFARPRSEDCRVCLARFEAESVPNRLPCGHLFHRSCVERWVEYGNNTCPLCRSPLLTPDNLGRDDDSLFGIEARSHL